MLDPHIRIALPPVEGAPGMYSVQFRAPDRHGVFKFVINYKRKGYVPAPLQTDWKTNNKTPTSFTHLFSSSTVSLVPPRHDEYPRFISAAWPYYIGAISTSVGFLLFSTIWLAGEIKVNKKGKGRKTE
jgi:oligosaccharyltransferase complex subunit beta